MFTFHEAICTARQRDEVQAALKVSTDPTRLGVSCASAKQAGNTPNYGQGWGSRRGGAVATDGFSDIMIGGAMLPSFCARTRATSTRELVTARIHHAYSVPLLQADNGRRNRTSLLGRCSSIIQPPTLLSQINRGAGLVFGNFAIGIAERIGANVAQEFLLGRFTRRGGHMK
jgi:hypothetical protein